MPEAFHAGIRVNRAHAGRRYRARAHAGDGTAHYVTITSQLLIPPPAPFSVLRSPANAAQSAQQKNRLVRPVHQTMRRPKPLRGSPGRLKRLRNANDTGGYSGDCAPAGQRQRTCEAAERGRRGVLRNHGGAGQGHSARHAGKCPLHRDRPRPEDRGFRGWRQVRKGIPVLPEQERRGLVGAGHGPHRRRQRRLPDRRLYDGPDHAGDE